MESQVLHSLGSFLPKLRLRLKATDYSDVITGTLFFLLWLAPTIRWRIELGGFSVAFLEPVTLFVIGILILSRFSPRKSLKLYIDTFVILLILFFMWMVSTRIWDKNWTHGLSDLRDWGIPILTFIVILSLIKHRWRKWILIVIPIALLHSILGLYQHFTNHLRPFASLESIYKLDFSGTFRPSIAVGLFEHPNSLAVFLMIAITVALGWMLEQPGTKRKLIPASIILFFCLVLYWTYAKAEILVLVLMIFLFFSVSYIRSSKIFIALCVLCILALIIGGWFAINKWPSTFNTIWWRLNLWQSVFRTFTEHPGNLLWGNADVPYADISIWPQPHNIFFDILLNYGLIGLLLLLIFIGLFFSYGAISYRRGDLQRNLILRAVWISIFGFILTGLVESSLLGIETRMIFLLLTASFIGVRKNSLLLQNSNKG